MKQPPQVFQRVGNALQKMGLAFIKAAEAISAQGLHYADINVAIEVPHEHFAIQLNETGESIEIVIEQLLAQLRRQISFGIVQERRDVILQRASSATLVVQKKRSTV